MLREQLVAKRMAQADLRELAMGENERTVRAGIEARANDQAQLREANEQLVLATFNAQEMAQLAQKATAKMSYLAEHDVLTGLPNRALFDDRLAQAVALARRNRRRVALLYLDLDSFKHINDSMGHGVGDQVLRSCAKRIQYCTRASDTVSRQGGDEFVVLLPDLNTVDDATLIAQKVLNTMAEPYVIDGQSICVTLSIGISVFPDDSDDVVTAVKNADTAMYHAKRNGRCGYRVFTAQMNADSSLDRS